MENQIKNEQSQIQFIAPYQLRVIKSDTVQAMSVTSLDAVNVVDVGMSPVMAFRYLSAGAGSDYYSWIILVASDVDNNMEVMFHNQTIRGLSGDAGYPSMVTTGTGQMATADYQIDVLKSFIDSKLGLIPGQSYTLGTNPEYFGLVMNPSSVKFHAYDATNTIISAPQFVVNGDLGSVYKMYVINIAKKFYPVDNFFRIDRAFVPIKTFSSSALQKDFLFKGKETFIQYDAIAELYRYLNLNFTVGLSDFTIQPSNIIFAGDHREDDRLLIYELL